MTVTTLRAPLVVVAGAGAPTGAPQLSQKRASASSSAPHAPHRAASDAPHPAQKRAPSRFGRPHPGQPAGPPAEGVVTTETLPSRGPGRHDDYGVIVVRRTGCAIS
jgi:hypothetical protein